MKTIITLSRNGIFHCSKKVPNQCKSIGHDKYKYWVALKCENKLDEDGFIIDQLEVNSLIVMDLQLKSMSCEQYAQRIAEILLDECNRRKIVLYHLYVKVAPIALKQVLRAFVELDMYLEEPANLYYK